MRTAVIMALLLLPLAALVSAPTAVAFCQTQSVAGVASVTYDDGRGYACRLGVALYACEPRYYGGSGLHPGKVVLECGPDPILVLP